MKVGLTVADIIRSLTERCILELMLETGCKLSEIKQTEKIFNFECAREIEISYEKHSYLIKTDLRDDVSVIKRMI